MQVTNQSRNEWGRRDSASPFQSAHVESSIGQGSTMRTILLIILIFAIARCSTQMARTTRAGNIIQVAGSDCATDPIDIGFNRPLQLRPELNRFVLYNSVSPSRLRGFPGRGKPVAYYKHSRYLAQSDHDIFDKTLDPGINTPYSGIYRCEVCGSEATSIKDNPLPPWNHHQHRPGQSPIRWRLVVGHQPDPNR